MQIVGNSLTVDIHRKSWKRRSRCSRCWSAFPPWNCRCRSYST